MSIHRAPRTTDNVNYCKYILKFLNFIVYILFLYFLTFLGLSDYNRLITEDHLTYFLFYRLFITPNNLKVMFYNVI